MRGVSSSNIVKILVNTLIGLALIYLWTRFVDLGEILAILAGVKLEYLAGFVVLYLISALFRAYRLTILLEKQHFGLKEATLLFFLSQFLSMLIPIRAGEIAKGVYFSARFRVPFSQALTWSLIDRFVDFWVLFILAGVLLLIVPTTLPPAVGLLSLGLALLLTVLSLFFLMFHNLSLKIIKFLSLFLIFNPIKRLFISVSTSILSGFQILRLDPLRLGLVVVSTLVAYGLDAAFWWMVWLALGQDIGYLRSSLGNLLLALTFLLPAAPGMVGSAEASGLVIFSGLFGIEGNLASAATITFHLMLMATAMVLGIVSLYLLKFDLSLVWRQFRRE